MEVGLMIATFVMSALSALCSVAALTILLVTVPKEGADVHSPAEEKTAKPPDMVEDVEKRRREAVNARQHSNFMNYDGTAQAPIDPNTILGE